MPIKTFRGMIPLDTENTIPLSTNNGATGYRIIKFQIMSNTPGEGNHELIGKIRSTPDPNINAKVDFNDTAVLAACYHTDLGNLGTAATSDSIIIDSEVFNQDIYVQIADATSATVPCNYYIELEQMDLNMDETTVATLKNIRNTQ